MKILIATDIPIDFVCGSTGFVRELCKGLKKRGHDVAVVCPGKSMRYKKFSFDKIKIFGVASIPVLVQKYLRLSPPVGLSRHISRVIADFKPDIVHAQTHFVLVTEVLKHAKKQGVPCIVTNHFMPENVFYHFRLPEFFENTLQWVGWKHLLLILDRFQLTTTPTETAAGPLKKAGFKKDVEVISNGVDLERFKYRPASKDIEKKFNLTPKIPRLLYLGRLDPEKNVDVIIKAIALVCKKIRVQLIIAGRGQTEMALKTLVEDLKLRKYITFTGFVKDGDLPLLYNAADFFVIASTAELQSIATMEAMASGLAVVAANSMALPELVHNGKNGFLFEPGDAEALSMHIEKLAADLELRKKMSEAGLNIIKDHDVRLTVEKFERIYNNLVKVKNVQPICEHLD